MKCELTDDGVLRIMPESPVEQFALSKWDKTRIEIMHRDLTFMLLDNCKTLAELIGKQRDKYLEFLRSEGNVLGSGDSGGANE